MKKHTQGPWEVRKLNNNTGARIWNPVIQGFGDIAHVYETARDVISKAENNIN